MVCSDFSVPKVELSQCWEAFQSGTYVGHAGGLHLGKRQAEARQGSEVLEGAAEFGYTRGLNSSEA